MADDAPMYGPFFGVMGATAAVVFGGRFYNTLLSDYIVFFIYPIISMKNFFVNSLRFR